MIDLTYLIFVFVFCWAICSGAELPCYDRYVGTEVTQWLVGRCSDLTSLIEPGTTLVHRPNWVNYGVRLGWKSPPFNVVNHVFVGTVAVYSSNSSRRSLFSTSCFSNDLCALMKTAGILCRATASELFNTKSSSYETRREINSQDFFWNWWTPLCMWWWNWWIKRRV